MIESAVLMCHAPIVVPEVGGARGAACRSTTRAMERVARKLVEGRPDVVIVISPHARRRPTAYGLGHERRLRFKFSRFGVEGLAFDFSGASEAASAVHASAGAFSVATFDQEHDPYDHGASVPLYFAWRAGLRAPILVVSLPHPGTNSEVRFGQALREASERLGQRWSILASGDLSHALLAGAPAGFHPRAQSFDQAFVGHLTRGDLRAACAVDGELRALACEDAVDSTAVAAGAVDFDARGHELLSYEGPFGVGYAEALLFDRGAPPKLLGDIARDSVHAFVAGKGYAPPELDVPWQEARAVFVTLRDEHGQLRGCVGRLEPTECNLASEIAVTARSAASHDPRFPVVAEHELAGLRFEVSVLARAERVSALSDLDPAEYGVVVTQGIRRGVLLPNVEGVDSAETQFRIACQKGQIDPEAPHGLERFRVHKVLGRA
jgi:MEMO1 family protein